MSTATTEIPIVLVDIDGTLADLSHRLEYIRGNNRDWDSFLAEEAVSRDVPRRRVVELVVALSQQARVWLVSGRPERTREVTERWLNEAGVPYDTLTMRPDGDYTPDDQLKLRYLNAMLDCDRTAVWLVIDDRTRCVRMWRAAGLTCLQVAEGDY